MKPSKKILSKSERLGELTLQKEVIEAEIKELRTDLESMLTAGEEVEFVASDQKFLLKKRIEDKAILKDTTAIRKVIGEKNFMIVAKVTKTDIESTFGKATLADCVLRYDEETKLVLRKLKG